jgi:hypothetical protein
MMPNHPGSGEISPAPGARVAAPVVVQPPVYRWYHKLWAVVLVTFCLEIGLFLVVFPWTSYWETNYFSQILPGLHVYWYNSYVRGAVSGLGALNLYVAILEIFHLRRFARRR